jgi:MGT family glycosyltransferase
MRVLLTSLPATGHWHSLLPLAEALADAGHEVAVACTPAFAARVTDDGFEHLAGGAETFEELFVDAPPRTDRNRWRWAQRVAFATRAAGAMLPDLERHLAAWRPDVIVREGAEFAGCLVAERHGLPHASIATASWGNLDERRAFVADVLDGWRTELGMEPDPAGAMVFRYLHLAFTPPQWDAGANRAPTTHFIRYANPRARAERIPPWLDTPRDRPLVFASLGTVHHAEAGLFEAILEAVADEPIEVVAAIGRDQEAGRFGEAPANVRIVPYAPQIAVLERAAAFITHGGFNSAKEALSLGVPLVVIPIAADQHYTADRVEALGLGHRVGRDERTREIIRRRLRDVLADPAFGARARRFADAMAALPGVDHAVGLLERLVRERRPIPGTG